MKMKVLKMAVLVLALLVVSGIRASHMPAANAEEPLLRFEVGSENMWENA